MLLYDKASQKLAIGLAILAGYIDSLGFLSLGGVFVSFMSGNSTRFAVGLFENIPLGIKLIPFGMIVLFVTGVMAGRCIRHFRQGRASSAILLFMLAMLFGAAILYEVHFRIFATALMAIAMGAANNVFFREGEVSVGVTYMTGTLVKFGQRLAGTLLGEKDNNWRPYLMLWAGLIGGATLGSAGFQFWGLHCLWGGIAICGFLYLDFKKIEKQN